MKAHRDASNYPSACQTRFRGHASYLAMAALLLLLGNFNCAFGIEQAVMAPVFAADEAILSDNTDAVLRKASALPPDQQFELLARWVLPSNSRPGFRMKARFASSDANSAEEREPAGGTVEGIRTPVFLLIAVARETNRLEELRRTVVMLEHPMEPHEQRAKLALLFMVDSAIGNREAAAESLSALSALVRSRSENLDGRWWPETLALAYGMQHPAARNDMLELATSIYDPQIGQSIWSGAVEWDLFVAGCFARLQPAEQHGIAQTQANAMPVDGTAFVDWIPSSVFTAESRGRGFPDSNWLRSGSTVRKVGGHNGDFLYLPVPITGNFEVVCDVTSFDYREAALSYGGRYVQHHWTRTNAEFGTVRGLDVLPLDKPITNPDSWLSSRIKVQDGVVTHYLNGRRIWQRTLPMGSSLWLALRAFRLSRGSVRNLAIAGTPVIPASIELGSSAELEDWFSYYDEPVALPDNPNSWTLSTADGSPPEILHPRQPELSGAAAESLLVYHRPVIEDGVLEYDFYYSPGESIVHPAIDRMVLLLTPEGVRSHSITDGKWQRDNSDPQNVSDPQFDEGAVRPVSLLPSAWNKLQLQFAGRSAQVVLNGSVLCRVRIPESSSRQFGLFHYAGESSVRVRNLRWSSDWGMRIDSPTFPRSTQADVAEIERATAALPFTKSQSLNNMDRHGDYIIRKGGKVLINDDGVELNSVSTGGWSETRLPLWISVRGDFDLQASFTNFVHGSKGEAGFRLATLLDESLQRVELSRNAGNDQQQKLKTQISVLKPDGQREYFDRWSTSEVTAGTLRIVRLGTRLHYLLAESDSRVFRLLGTDDVSTDDLRVGDLCLATYTDKLGISKITWTSILVRAKQLSGDPIPDLRLEAKTLDERRNSMRVDLLHDFATMDPVPAGFYRWSDVRPWSKSNGGLNLVAVGADTWQSAGISTQLNVSGDFDMRIEFDSLKLAVPTAGHQSGLHFQIDPATERSVELNSMIGVDASGINEAEGYTRSELRDSSIEFRGTERHSVTSATALRIVRHGQRYFMLVRAEDENEDRIVSITENTTAPIRTLRITLHTGGAGRESSVRLRRLEVRSEPRRR